MKVEELRSLLERGGIHPTRGKGQNFLIEENLARAIADDGGVGPEDVALEVGTGLGILTRHLVERAHHVVTVELDERVAALARERLGAPANLTLFEGDALRTKNELNPEVSALVRERCQGGRALRIVANLPYAVATPLVLGYLAEDLPLARMVVMVQLEAAERFAAGVGHEEYGAVSVLTGALTAQVKLLRRVPREVFWPRPQVASAVVRFDPRPGAREGFAGLAEVVRALFNFRRKTLGKGVREVQKREPHLAWLEGALEQVGIDRDRRPEQLTVDEFRRLANCGPNPDRLRV